MSRRIAGAVVLALTSSLLGPAVSQAIAAEPDFTRVWSPPNTPLSQTPSVNAAPAPKPSETAPHYPVPAASNTVSVRTPVEQKSATAGLTSTPSQAGTLPVWVSAAEQGSAPDAVTVVQADTKTADAARVNGLLLSVSATAAGEPAPAGDGASKAVKVAVDVAALDAASGTVGDFASRGRLVTMPSCALTTPQVPSCLVRTPVAATYDPSSKRLIADLELPSGHTGTQPAPGAGGAVKAALSSTSTTNAPAVLLGAETGASGGGGTYQATSLSSSSAWAAGNSSGSLTYNYNVEVPPALGGAAPLVSLAYDSSSVDGKTSATNAQASWVGDGWDFNPGFIERSYTPCDKDGITDSGDLCWGGFNATLSLGSHAGPLVRESRAATTSDEATGVWHLKNDDGTRIEFGADPGNGNGTYNGAYAKVTDISGTAYYFGLNHLPGGDKSDPATQSASTVPVYAPNSGDPCYDAAKGKASWCQMWQRLSLDYVVDAHGNLITYTWAPETNYYSRGAGQNNGNGTLTAYTRANTLSRIDYGQRLADQVAAKGALQPAARIAFTTAERCLTTGSACDPANRTVANKNNWPDVPVDQECKDTGTCTIPGPTYFTTKRLTSATTQVRVNNAWQDVDSYELTHSFRDPKDVTSDPKDTLSQRVLWLDSVQRTGKTATPNVSTPAVSFVPVMLANRVDGSDLVPAPSRMNRPRIQQIRNETGGVLNVDYNDRDCSRVNHVMPTAEDENTRACFPVRWSVPGSIAGADPVLDWFNHYTVRSLTENDFATGAPARLTAYDYGPAAWHRDDSQFTDPKARTWNDFRGFATVTATVGSGNDGPKTRTVTTYRQGMDGDVLKSGTKRTVAPRTDALGRSITDVEWLSGQVLQTETIDLTSGKAMAQVVNSSTRDIVTASQPRSSGLPDLVARYPATVNSTTSRARKADDTWRATTRSTTGDETHGNRPIVSLDQADALPDLCTRTAYATGPDLQRIDQIAETLTVSGPDACTAMATGANTVSRERVFYDGKPYQQAASTADQTSKQVLDRYDSTGAPVFTTVSAATFDAYGRTVSITDPNSTDPQHPNGAANTTSYTSSAAGELPTTVTVSAPIPGAASGTWDTVTTFDSRRSLPLTVKDANGKTATESYDALGRLTAVWAPGRAPELKPNANLKFDYTVSNTTGAPSTTTTSTLTSDVDTPVYAREITLSDGFARPRQTQSTPAGPGYTGRLITDTQYDSQGRAWATNATWFNKDSNPSTTLVSTPDSDIPAQTRLTFDGLGRQVTSAFWSLGVLQHQTTTAYPDAGRTDVVPPQGAWPTTTLTDARGRTTEAWQYRTATATGQASDAAVTRRTYTPAGQIAGMTDAAGNTWTYTYDLRGRQTSATDPDTGTTSRTYDGASRVSTSTDAKGQVLTYTYDLLGRKSGLYQGTVTPATQLAAWTFDTVMKGRPASSTRYVGGSNNGGQAYTTAITGYDNGYRPTGTTLTIPGTEAGLDSGTYTYATSTTYDQITGNPKLTTLPATGGLPQDRLAFSYNDYGQMFSYAGATTYDVQTSYDAYGRPLRSTVNPWGTQVVATTDYDQATGRIRGQFLDKQTSTLGAVQQTNYTYDAVGSITSITDIPDNNPAATDRQCFTYDYLGRLTTAWTDTGGITTPDPLQHKTLDQGACTNTTPTSGAVAPAKTTVGGSNPYWQEYTYDLTGNRTSLIQHDQYGDPAKDVTTTQQFPTPGTVNTPTTAATTGGGTGGAHALLGSTVKTGATTTANGATQYDAAGNTTAIRTGIPGTGTSALTWNSEGKLASYTAPAQITGNGGTCLATAGGSNANGTNLQINTCNNSGTQLYTVANSKLVVLDKCVQAMGTTAGSAVQLQACDNSAAQTWNARPDGTIHNPASNQCLAIPGDVTTPNTALALGTCASTVPAGQKWTVPNTTTTYLYDADGNQLIRRNPGQNTITLGTDELTVNTTAKTQTGSRYYPIPGGLTIVRQGAGTAAGTFVVQATDHHGTGTTSIDLATTATTRRTSDPFGNPRGNQPAPGTWLGTKGYIGGTKDDTTNLTNLGARQYQPATGRFISPDPILDQASPQQWNAYSYSNNNPVDLSDPSGLRPPGKCDGDCAHVDGSIDIWAGGPGNWQYANISAQVTDTEIITTTQYINFKDPSRSVIAHDRTARPKAPKPDNHCYYAMGSWEGPGCHRAEPKGNPNYPSTYMKLERGGPLATWQKIFVGAIAIISLAIVAAPVVAAATPTCLAAIIACSAAIADVASGEAAAGSTALAGAGVTTAARLLACNGNSFAPDTPVLLADGTTKPISEVQPGDEVIATDPETDTTSAEPVTDIIVGSDDRDFTDLTVANRSDPTKPSTITSTQKHPYWNETTRRWTNANDLKIGDHLRTADGTTVSVLQARSYHASPRPAENLTVANLHTYYVLAGTTPILVHNTDGAACGLVPYGSTELSRATAFQRLLENNKGNNFGAARLEDGTILIGRSSAGIHAEEDLIRQAGDRRIVELYSERQPCANKCEGLTAGMKTSWSWQWNGVDRGAVNAEIKAAINDLFK
ncbi:ricin-type beta-trefoil lectin domain protein [Kitasatospora sp. NPDC057512]|uniref:ricin-type beta-trefoil lectin domain protein n=1 Tax=Kitasatospora sp. NPDC057512 TaxID=3346154 RepID=UPI0036C8FF94